MEVARRKIVHHSAMKAEIEMEKHPLLVEQEEREA